MGEEAGGTVGDWVGVDVATAVEVWVGGEVSAMVGVSVGRGVGDLTTVIMAAGVVSEPVAGKPSDEMAAAEQAQSSQLASITSSKQ